MEPVSAGFSRASQVAEEEGNRLMMAFVLVQTAVNSLPVANYLRALNGIESADDVKGPYDAIAVARPDETSGPLERILAEIRLLPGVTRALVATRSDREVAMAGGTEAA
jgi:hypothetical protein